MKKIFFRVRMAIVLSLFFSSSALNAQSFNANLAAKLQDTLNFLVASNPNTKGISASVFCPGMGIWQGVAGISHPGVPLTPEMEFMIASNTKLFTSVTLIMLAEDNIISLEDPISAYIPNFANVDPNITIRQLLNHTSGVADMYVTTAQLDSVAADPNRIWTPEEVLAWVGAPLFPAGTSYGYSNTNYILAGMIAESATGYHISQLIRDSILTPLNLDSTFYDVQEVVLGFKAHPWKSGVDINNISRNSINSAIGPAGAMYSTSGEMAQWYRALMNGAIINASSFAEMTTFLPPQNYGLGIAQFAFNGSTEWGHGGITEGSRSRTIYDPCREAFVCCLSNSNPSGVDGVTAILHKVLVDNLPGCPGAITGLISVCKGDNSITYTIPAITNTTSYIWTLPGGATGMSVTNSITVDFGLAAVSGNIEVKGTNLYGESATVTLAVTVNNLPSSPTISIINDTLHSDAPVGNQWYLDGVLIPGATSQDYVFTTNGNYYSIVTISGCSSTPSNAIPTSLGAENELETNMLSIYPNPSNGIFRLNVGNINEGRIYIYNYLGQQIYQSTNLTNEIDFSTQPGGTYFIKLFTESKIYSQKIIIQ